MVYHKGKEPLDYDNQDDHSDGLEAGKKKWVFFLESIPILILAAGVLFKRMGHEYWIELILIGGGVSSLIYLLFSWYLFKVNEYRLIEVAVSVLTGLFFFLSFVGIIFKLESWSGASLIYSIGIYGGMSLFAICAFMYLFYLSDERASRFYQNILARLLVLITILLSIMSVS